MVATGGAFATLTWVWLGKALRAARSFSAVTPDVTGHRAPVADDLDMGRGVLSPDQALVCIHRSGQGKSVLYISLRKGKEKAAGDLGRNADVGGNQDTR